MKAGVLETTRAPEEEPSTDARRGARWPSVTWLPVAWMALAALPFLLAAVRVAGRDIAFGTDIALSLINTSDAAHGDQLLGAYSRFGWSHPGPFLYYALAPVFLLLGSTAGAFWASFLVLQAAVAALLVAAVGRERPWARPLAAAAVLAYSLGMPDSWLVLPWNPYALFLPTALLVVVAARAMTGSPQAVVGTALIGTFLAQTHVGTVPLAAALMLLVLCAWPFTRRPASRRDWAWTAAGAGLVVLAWLPPLAEQLRAPAGQGNIAHLFRFFTEERELEGPSYTLAQGAAITGRALGTAVFQWPPGALDVDDLPRAGVLLLIAVLVGAALLGWAGWQRREPATVALAGTIFGATVTAIFSAAQLSGTVDLYLIAWPTVLPFVLAFGWYDLLLRAHRPEGVARAVVASLLIGLSLLWTQAALGAVDEHADWDGVPEALDLVDDRLGDRSEPVLLGIGTHMAWRTTAGLAAALELDGYEIRVEDEWGFMFGEDRVATGDEGSRLTLIAADAVDDPANGLPEPLGVVDTLDGPFAVILSEP